MLRLPILVLLVSLIAWLVVGCSEPPKENLRNPASAIQLVAADPVPADLGINGCSGFLRSLQGSEHELTLQRLLTVRPHKQWRSADREDIVQVPGNYVLASRRDPVIFGAYLHRDVLPSLLLLMDAAIAEGVELRLRSAFRTPEHQNAMWKKSVARHQSNLALAGFVVAPPCHSEHATGKAVDFAVASGEPIQPGVPAFDWLALNAHKYEWQQSFSVDTGAALEADEPGVSVEPWHYRHASLLQPDNSEQAVQIER